MTRRRRSARIPEEDKFEIWLGESKLYKNGSKAIADAIASVRAHIEAGFLSNEKILLGPQIPKTTPNYDQIAKLFAKNAKLDDFLSAAVFPIGIICNSVAAAAASTADDAYVSAARSERDALAKAVAKSGLADKIRLVMIYIPVPSKAEIVKAFDKRLKGLQ